MNGLVMGLLAGAVSTGALAQQPPSSGQALDAPVQAPSTRSESERKGAERAQEAPPMEFRGADGKLLPPDVQRQLREHFRKNPLPADSRIGPQGAGDVVVTGQRPRGAVIGDIPPERTFNGADIRAFGADNIGALMDAIGPQVASNRGRGDGGPVTLLNGRRVSDFSEIARIPAEAIERMEVFPEELALKYGFRADQKVVNVVTLERYDARIAQLGYTAPTEGGRDAEIVNADYLALRGDTRLALGATYSRSGLLLESDRDVRQLAGEPELGRLRSLLPATEQATLNGLISGPVLSDVSATLNGRVETIESESLLGLGAGQPLRRETDRQVAHLGTTLNGRVGPWIWTFTGNYDRASTEIVTDLADARDEARSVDALGNIGLLLSGPLVALPAGPVLTSVRAGVEVRDFESRSLRGGVGERAELSRDQAVVQSNLDLPLLSRDAQGGSQLGRLSANANLAIERLSDAGTLRTFGYGINWSPVEAVSFIVSATHEEGAPTMEQLGGPLLVTPNVRTFDFSRREVVDVTRLSGGNPNLRTDDRRVVRLGLNARPFARTDLVVSVDYVSTHIDNPIAPFPVVTPEIEAAFPDRFTRDGEDRLIRIDGRPLNFVRSDQEQLRWGVDFTRPLGSVPPGMQNVRTRTFASEADARRAFPNATIITAEAGSPLARRAETMNSRLFFSFYHTWRLQDEIVVRDGLPALDLLDGSAVDFRGGRRRHEVEFQAGAFKRGLGARVTANWQSGTTVQGLGGAAGDLRFANFAVVNVNLFANLADQFGGTRAPKWLKGTRVTLGVTNLFNTRPQVRDRAGTTPLSYQPAYLDPLGRTLNFSIRKVL